MRNSCLALCLTAGLLLAGFAARAFEQEGRILYEGQPGGPVLRMISTADREPFEPIILAFQERHPEITVDYTIATTSELMAAIYDEGVPFDLAISSAMDLQTKVANDGFARSYRSEATDALPSWAKWRNQLFGFTQEPAVLVLASSDFAPDEIPATREDLVDLLRDNPGRFEGRIGTYDVRTSGLGYLMATQDSRQSDSYWRLTEVMGRLDSRLYCCSGDMIADVANGKLAIAYNVLGSYAAGRVGADDGVLIVELSDYVSVMLRTALIPVKARNIRSAEAMIDFLATLRERPDLVSMSGLPAIDDIELATNNALRPIEFGPGLLVFLDRLKRDNFLRSWESSIVQN